ncbi:MAG: hypothetical protein II510_01760, partial [Erysipelotrichales bacterium]|nr:hypothetical protein [Erysipelotrichales bacterium]
PVEEPEVIEESEPVAEPEPVIEREPEPVEEPVEEPGPEPAEEPQEPERYLVLRDRTNKAFERIKHFAGSAEEQIDAAMTYLKNYVFEKRVPAGAKEEIPNYREDIVRKLLENAMALGDTDAEVSWKGIAAQLPLTDANPHPEWRVSAAENGTRYFLPVHPFFKKQAEAQNPAAAGQRRSSDETKRLILKVLEKEPCSTNMLAKRLGYKGISKTLSGIVKEMIDDGEIEYTNPNSRGSNQKLRKKGFKETYGNQII